MPPSWTSIASAIQAGGTVSPKSPETLDVVGAWYQEVRDLALILSRQLKEDVDVRVPRAHANDPSARLKFDADLLASENCLKATFLVPNAAGPIEVLADFRKRSVFSSMRISAPGDRKSTKARVNWLVRQLSKSKPDGIHVRFFWPGRGPFTQHPLEALRQHPEIAEENGKIVSSFEIVYARDLGARFSQRRNFIVDLENSVPEFYEHVGQHLKSWQPAAPKLKEDRVDPSEVNTQALQEEAEQSATTRSSLAN